MTQSPPQLGCLDGIPTHEILEGLARLHQLVLVADSRGRILWMSDALGVICGCASGDDFDRLYAQLPEIAHPEQIASFQNDLRTKETVTDVRIELRHKEGRPIEVDASAFKVDGGRGEREEQGELPLYVVVVRPVEEPDYADHKLRDTVDFLAALLDSSPEGVIATDRAGFIAYVNHAAETLFDRASEDLIGKPAAGILSTFTEFGRILSALQTNGEIRNANMGLKRADGGESCVSISSCVLRLADGTSGGTVTYVRDVTHQRHTEEELELKNAELESYVHNVSHDLRSPLVSLLGFSRLLRQDYERLFDETGRHFLDRIEQAGRTMEALISDLLELSRIGASGEHRTWVDPRSVLQQLQAELKLRLEERGVKLYLPTTLPLVFSDRTRLYQVFSNLIGNALEHMGPCPNPEIRVKITEQPGHHLISVADNGKGICREDHERIFDAFRTLESSRDRRGSAGIGLAIVKKIAETHRGRAWVESTPGHGTCFLVAFPRNPDS